MNEKECPQCNYPMDKELIRKGGTYKKRIENYSCACCGHSERVGDKYEHARSCINNPIPQNPE